tara:strand:+ start:215 stop:382 length:168 start_codon:yes stop_codon:yes gene_type:complete
LLVELKVFKRNPHKNKRGFKFLFTLTIDFSDLEEDQLEKTEVKFEVVVGLRELNL